MGEHDDSHDDSGALAASLAARIDRLTFVDRAADAVTALLVEAVVAWGTEQGWRVYRRAPSVLRLPAPYEHRLSCLDVACARPGAAPVVVEVDRSDRRRTIDKLLAEAAAGRVAVWVRWGTRRFTPPPSPITMVTCEVIARQGGGERGRRFSRLPSANRPAPTHLSTAPRVDQQPDLFPPPLGPTA